ncbi:MAG: hypothetical protein AB1345_09080 [Chloroflexota bacterium]
MRRKVKWSQLWQKEELRKRILVTLFLLVVYRLAANVPVPGVDKQVLAQAVKTNTSPGMLIELLDLLSGGTFAKFSVLALGIQPYLAAMALVQVFLPLFPALKERVEDIPSLGRKMLARWAILLTIPLALLNAFGQIRLLSPIYCEAELTILPQFGFREGNLLFTLTTLITMTTGSLFAVWLAHLIGEYGIERQGINLILVSGIVVGIYHRIVGLPMSCNVKG